MKCHLSPTFRSSLDKQALWTVICGAPATWASNWTLTRSLQHSNVHWGSDCDVRFLYKDKNASVVTPLMSSSYIETISLFVTIFDKSVQLQKVFFKQDIIYFVILFKQEKNSFNFMKNTKKNWKWFLPTVNIYLLATLIISK